MSAPAPVVALWELKAQLETIKIANGYRTDIGKVFTGRGALAVGSNESLPTITLTMLGDVLPDGEPDIEAGERIQYWMRNTELQAYVDGKDDWEVALDALLDDVRRALTIFRKPLRIGSPNFGPPAASGETASFLMMLKFPYELNYFV